MKTLEITVDLETCALCPTAAVMSIGAVAWDMTAPDSPFLPYKTSEFLQHVDLRSSFLDGLTFDPQTSEWWASQPEKAKAAVLANDSTPLTPIKDVLENFFCWIEEQKERNQAESVNLWSQGSDFDIAILRNLCYKYGIEIPVPYTNFRDHRTFFLESARIFCDANETEFRPQDAYKMVEDYADGKGTPHDPVFDCKRSIYSAWQINTMRRTIS